MERDQHEPQSGVAERRRASAGHLPGHVVSHRHLQGAIRPPADVEEKRNFAGDGQADLSAHGGIDKAVYCYPFEHYDFWGREIGRADLPMGQFGENVTTAGLLEHELRIGDILRMGTAVVQVSEPRIPCYKLVMRMDAGSDFSVRFLAANRTGFYCRVLEEGAVKRSDAITLISSDTSSPTVREVIGATQFADRDPVALRCVVRARDISAKWRSRVRRMIDAEVRRRIEVTSPPTAAMSVEKIVSETNDIVSIWLRPDAGARMFNLLPGQYLTIVWPDGFKSTYSLSALSPAQRCRITVKLVRNRQGALGRSSARIAALKAGDIFTVERPRGNFHPDLDDDTPLVLAGAGIGVTPIMSMIEHATRSGRRDVFAAFGMRRPGVHPLASELAAFLAERQRLKAVLAYSQLNGAPPLPGLPAPKHGRLAAADLLPHAAAPLAEVFLCGPGDFIRQVHDGLVEAGVNPLQIRATRCSDRRHYCRRAPCRAIRRRRSRSPSRAATWRWSGRQRRARSSTSPKRPVSHRFSVAGPAAADCAGSRSARVA